jgi:hypothetical protein
LTIVAAWISALTGVGASMASGSQVMGTRRFCVAAAAKKPKASTAIPAPAARRANRSEIS